VNSTKAHIAALSLLDRALIATTDEEMTALLAGLPDDHVSAVKRISAVKDDSVVGSDLIDAIREAARRGRLNGDLQRLGVVLTDACLADCVEQLGENAELPTEEQLQEVIPGLIERHQVGAVRMMFASVVVGEAPASPAIIGLLKTDPVIQLPPSELKPLAPVLAPKPVEAAVKEARKARKAAEQAAAKLRREQIARAKNRV
jgi:hypothetical protein